MPLPDRGNRQSKHRYLNSVNRKADNQLARFKFALRNTNLVSRRGILPRPRELTMLGIGKRESAPYLEHTPHPVGRASRPATRQRIIGQTPKKALTYALILQYIHRRGHSRAIFARPDAQATNPPFISELIIRYNKFPRDKRWFVPTGQRPRTHGLVMSVDTSNRSHLAPVFSRHSMNCATTSP